MRETRKRYFRECFPFTPNNISNVTNDKIKGAQAPKGLVINEALRKAP